VSQAGDKKVAGRYANALFAAATKTGKQAAVATDLGVLVDLWRKTPALRKTLESPVVPEKDKHSVLDEIFKTQVDPLSLSFLHLLMKKRRESILEPVQEQYQRRYDTAQGLVRAEAIVAAPLDAAEQSALVAALEKRTGKKIQLSVTENSDILGGMILRMSDKVVDGSVRGALERFRSRMLQEL
jgi:F-type H+-transporting ATPase subunit delta